MYPVRRFLHNSGLINNNNLQNDNNNITYRNCNQSIYHNNTMSSTNTIPSKMRAVLLKQPGGIYNIFLHIILQHKLINISISIGISISISTV